MLTKIQQTHSAGPYHLSFRVPTAWYEVDVVKTISTEPHLIRQCLFKQLSVFTALSTTIPQGMLSIAFPVEKNLDQPMISLVEKLAANFKDRSLFQNL